MNNKEKQIREELKKLVIMGCHPGKSYEEALDEEFQPVATWDGRAVQKFPITIGKVMQAAHNLGHRDKPRILLELDGELSKMKWGEGIGSFGKWKLTKENGQECTDDDQTIEIIEKLLTLLK